MNLETLAAKLTLQGSGFSAGMQKAYGEVDGLQARMARVGAKMGAIGQKMTLGITAPLIGVGGYAINQASDLAEAQSAVGTVYGESADQIKGYSGSVAKDLGLSRAEALQAATGFGVFAKGAGLAGDGAASFSNDLVGASADLASFYNDSAPQVLEAINAGLTGETEPLRKYGIMMNDAAIQQYAMANGIWDGTGAMTEQQKILARQGFIMDNLGDANGDFERTQKGIANRWRVMQARAKDFAATVGTKLMPVAEQLMSWAEKFMGALEKLSPGMLKWGLIIAGVVAAIGPLLSVLGAIVSAFAPLAMVIGLLLSPIGLVIIAVGLLAYIFRDELLGALRTVAARVSEFVSDLTAVFRRLTGEGVSPVEAAIRALGSAFESLTGLEVSAFFKDVADAVGALLDGDWGGFADNIKSAFAGINWGALVEGARNLGAELLSRLGEISADVLSWAQAQFEAVDWGAVWANIVDIGAGILDKLGEVTTGLSSWFTNGVSAVPWRSILGASQDVLVGIMSEIPGKLGDAATTLREWWNSGTAIEWRSTLGAKMDSLIGIVSEIPGKLGDLGTEFKTWYDNAINSVDWGNLGFIIGEKIGNLAQTLAPKAGELIQGFLTAASSPGFWQGVAVTIGSLLLALPATIAYLGLTLAPKAAEFLGGFLEGLTGQKWSEIQTWLMDLPNKALAAVPGLTLTLLIKGQELISGILSGLTTYWPDVATWLGNLGLAAFNSIPGLTSTLLAKGQDLIAGILQGLVDSWPNVVTWLGEVGTKSFEAVGSLVATLVSRGVELIDGAITGLTDQWPTMSTWLADLGSKSFEAIGSLAATLLSRGVELIQGAIDGAAAQWTVLQGNLAGIGGAAASAVGDLSGVLYGAGQQIISGLISGIESMLGALTSKLGEVTNLIPAWKGPPSKDRVLLYKSGQLIMGGLIKSFEDSTRDIERSMSGMTDFIANGLTSNPRFSPVASLGMAAMAGMGLASMPTGDYIVNHNYFVLPEELLDIKHKAEAGANFAGSVGPEMGRKYGM